MTKAPPTPQQKDRIRAMVDRMMQAYGVEKKELSEILKSQIGTINNWVHFARTPFEQMAQCSEETGVSLDWLVHGKEQPKPRLSEQDVGDLVDIVEQAIDGAVAYETLEFCYPDAGEKLLKKLKKDLEAWHKDKSGKKPNGGNGDGE